jgi:hypothetical protein
MVNRTAVVLQLSASEMAADPERRFAGASGKAQRPGPLGPGVSHPALWSSRCGIASPIGPGALLPNLLRRPYSLQGW